MRADMNKLHLKDAHFRDANQACACDHCTYFKGIVYRSAIRQQLTGADELAVRKNNLAMGPRSLESIALREEVIEKRDHARYLEWCCSRTPIGDTPAVRPLTKVNKSTDLYTEPSNTVAEWLASSTKEELLSWLQKRDNLRDNMEELRQMGIFDLREYILCRQHAQNAPKKATISSHGNAEPSSPEPKKQNAKPSSADLRLQAHKNLKPPQAALRQREELRRWYECRRVPELKDECRQRGIKPLPNRKADMVTVLVEDDKRGV